MLGRAVRFPFLLSHSLADPGEKAVSPEKRRTKIRDGKKETSFQRTKPGALHNWNRPCVTIVFKDKIQDQPLPLKPSGDSEIIVEVF